MDWTSFFIVFLACAITMLICRVVPVFALKGRELPANAVRALNLIPVSFHLTFTHIFSIL